jgi:hypothetical protein
MKLLAVLISTFCIFSFTGKAQNSKTIPKKSKDNLAVFTWTTDMCEYTGKYDSKKITPNQLQNCYELWYNYSAIILRTKVTAYVPKEVSKLSIDELIQDYNSKKQHLQTMKVIETPFWENLRKQRQKELEENFELSKIGIQAYKNPKILQNNRFSKRCEDFVNPLASGDSLKILDSWIKFELSRKSSFGDNWNSRLKNINYKYESPERLQYATCYLITFGWWNCANKQLSHVEFSPKMELEFKKNFTQIKEKCEYAD